MNPKDKNIYFMISLLCYKPWELMKNVRATLADLFICMRNASCTLHEVNAYSITIFSRRFYPGLLDNKINQA